MICLCRQEGRGVIAPTHSPPDNRRKWVVSTKLGFFYPEKEIWYPLYWRLDGPRYLCGRHGKYRPHQDSISGPICQYRVLYLLGYQGRLSYCVMLSNVPTGGDIKTSTPLHYCNSIECLWNQGQAACGHGAEPFCSTSRESARRLRHRKVRSTSAGVGGT